MKLGQFLTMGILGLAALCATACETHRWACVRITATPAGATVRSRGLRGAHRLAPTRAPAGHYLPCSLDDKNPRVQVDAAHWRYVVSKPDFNDETIYLERSTVRSHCAMTREDARERPLQLRTKLVPLTTEKGLRNSVSISSDPPGAEVFDAGTRERIGVTPLKATFTFFAPYKVGRVVLLRLKGYQAAQRNVYVHTINLHVKMLRPGESPAPPRKAPPRPPTDKK